ncbi:MAG: LysR family transcriptional regulator [Proteobacteria bacterium]|nr:LysR family transcriptional regulator [Pseudomonadota bacterium]
MKLQQLRYIRALAECQSFVEAAGRCAVSQPTLSTGVALLEKDLGVRLFQRTTRRVELTQQGRLILPSIIDVLTAQEALLAKAQSLTRPKRSLLKIGVSPILGIRLVDLIIEPFQRSNPDVDVIFREMNLSELINLLNEGQLECLFGPVDFESPPSPKWNSARLYEEPLLFVASGAPDASCPSRLPLKSIRNETFVMVPEACGLAHVTRAVFRRHRYKLNEYPGEAISYAVLQEWAQLGIGAAILPRSKLAGRGSEIVGKDGALLTIGYQAIWGKQATQSREIARLAAYLCETAPSIAAGLAGLGSVSQSGVDRSPRLSGPRAKRRGKDRR